MDIVGFNYKNSSETFEIAVPTTQVNFPEGLNPHPHKSLCYYPVCSVLLFLLLTYVL